MREAAIVSTAHASIGKAYRESAEVEDVILGCAYPEGATGNNIAHQAALAAGLPISLGAMTINRFCISGLQAIAIAAQRITVNSVEVAVGFYRGMSVAGCEPDEMGIGPVFAVPKLLRRKATMGEKATC